MPENTPIGGFQSGFSAHIVNRKQAKYPAFLVCSHDCSEIVQLVSHVSGEVEFELCAIEAKRMAGALNQAVLPKEGIIASTSTAEDNHEIERKFLLPEFNHKIVPEGDMNILEVKHVEQIYLATGEEEVRIYRSHFEDGRTNYWHTVKVGLGLKRKEVETEITKTTYEQLRPRNGFPIYKTRTIFLYKGYGDVEFEIDVYDDGLRVIEVEFPNLESANAFEPPSWFGEEVTEDRSYKNQNLWLKRQSAA